jgi:hypothetical protein
MKKLYTNIFLVIIIAALASCKSATKLYEKGNYDEAVQVAVKKLQKDPNDAKLRSVVKDAYKYAVTDHENRIRNYSDNTSELRDEWIYNEYAALQNLYDAIYRSPATFELVHPTDYTSYLNSYADKAADMHYQHGLAWMQHGDKQSFKTAYHEFQAAMHFKQGDLTLQQAMADAYNAALTVVVIVPVDEFGYRYSSYNYELKQFNDDIVRNLQYNTGNEFVKFYSANDAQARNIMPDQVMEMRFSSMDIGRLQDDKNTREISKDVVVKETVYRADSVVKQWATVKAKITTTKRTVYSEADLRITVRDNAGHSIWNDDIRGTNNWATEFSAFTGDERALSEDDKKLISKKQDAAPKEEEIMGCIKESIYNDFVNRVRNYYGRY